MSTINEQIVTGRANRVLIDKATKLWQRISVWTKGSDVEFNDGQTAETKVGAIKGITTDLNTTEVGYAADMTALAQLNSDLGGFNPVIDGTGKITGYKTTVGGADTVFPFSEIDKNALLEALSGSGLNINQDSTPGEIYMELKRAFPGNITSAISTSSSRYNQGWNWYSIPYNLTGIKKLTFNTSSSYSSDVASGEKYYYDCLVVNVGVGSSASNSFIVSGSYTLGNNSYSGNGSTSRNVEVDVSSLIGNYYIGINAISRNAYTGGVPQYARFNGYLTCSGVLFS